MPTFGGEVFEFRVAEFRVKGVRGLGNVRVFHICLLVVQFTDSADADIIHGSSSKTAMCHRQHQQRRHQYFHITVISS